MACSENSLLSKEVQEKCADSNAPVRVVIVIVIVIVTVIKTVVIAIVIIGVLCGMVVICPRLRECGCYLGFRVKIGVGKSPRMCRSWPPCSIM